ncbi:MAG: DNA-directed RNA polymerase subunit alpha [Clostridia bacterium]|nr:DNA-directed RNA polymerase subunit alpha [Clostridia bacterium]
MIDRITPKITEKVIEPNKRSQFIVEPLERGYGITIGNSLRRILYTSLPGAAIIGVQIKDVMHEFTTIPGVKEDVSEIILNLKEVAVKIYREDLSQNINVTINKKTGGVITAGDIPGGTEYVIMNPDQYICTLEDGYDFNMTLTLGVGNGYKSSEENFPKGPIPEGYIPIDSIYTPVKMVSYTVEAARVGQNLNYDKLILDVETTGISTPREVASLAAKIMNDHLQLFVSLVDGMENRSTISSGEQEVAEKDEEKSIDISSLGLSPRPLNCLQRNGINTTSDLAKMTASDLRKIQNLGAKSYDEILAKLDELNISLKKDEEN